MERNAHRTPILSLRLIFLSREGVTASPIFFLPLLSPPLPFHLFLSPRQRPSHENEWILNRRNHAPAFFFPNSAGFVLQVINNFRPPMPLGNRVLRECGSFWARSLTMMHRDQSIPGEKWRERSETAAIVVDHGAAVMTPQSMLASHASSFNLHSVSWTFLAGITKCLLCLSRISGMVVGRRGNEGREKIFCGKSG